MLTRFQFQLMADLTVVLPNRDCTPMPICSERVQQMRQTRGAAFSFLLLYRNSIFLRFGLTRGGGVGTDFLSCLSMSLLWGAQAALSTRTTMDGVGVASHVWALLSNVECRRGTKLFRRTECCKRERREGRGDGLFSLTEMKHLRWKYQVQHQ